MPEVAPVTTIVFPDRSGMLSAVQRPPAVQRCRTGQWLGLSAVIIYGDDKAWGHTSKLCSDALLQTWLHNILYSILCSSGSLFVQAGEGAKCVACILPVGCLPEEATNTSRQGSALHGT